MSAGAGTPVSSLTTWRAVAPKTPMSRSDALSSVCGAMRGFTNFRTIAAHAAAARGGASTSTPSSSTNTRTSATIFPFAVSAAA